MGACDGEPSAGVASQPRCSFQPKGMNWLDREFFGTVVKAIHHYHSACLSCGLVCSEVRPEELRELVERKGLQKGTASGVCACVRCGRQDLIDCVCGSGYSSTIGYGFSPRDLRWIELLFSSRNSRIARPLYQYHVGCLSCGLVWFDVRPEELRDLIERKGPDELKGLLPPADAGVVECDPHRSPERLPSGPDPRRRGMNAKVLATANPRRLLVSIRSRASARKLRLLLCACVRTLRDSTTVRECQPTIEVAERFADGLATASELRAPPEGEGSNWEGWIAYPDAFEAARYLIPVCLSRDMETFRMWERRKRRECRSRYNRLVADVFDPLLSRLVAFDADWKTSTAVAVAQQMYDSRDFSTMPILADALQDAGCDNDDILNHCRDPEQPHIRGCWVVDLVLGKE